MCVAFLRAVERAVVPDIPAAQALLDPADEQLRAYRETQEETQAETGGDAVHRGAVWPFKTSLIAHRHAGTVFQRAREPERRPLRPSWITRNAPRDVSGPG